MGSETGGEPAVDSSSVGFEGGGFYGFAGRGGAWVGIVDLGAAMRVAQVQYRRCFIQIIIMRIHVMHLCAAMIDLRLRSVYHSTRMLRLRVYSLYLGTVMPVVRLRFYNFHLHVL